MKKILEKEIFGKSLGEWIHYFPVLFFLIILLKIFQVNLFSIRGYFLALIFFIILDVIFEKWLIK